jgi:hypothetical protein
VTAYVCGSIERTYLDSLPWRIYIQHCKLDICSIGCCSVLVFLGDMIAIGEEAMLNLDILGCMGFGVHEK